MKRHFMMHQILTRVFQKACFGYLILLGHQFFFVRKIQINQGGCVCHFDQTERATCRPHKLAIEDQNADGTRCRVLKTTKVPHLIGREACLQCKSRDAKGMLHCTNGSWDPLRTSSKSCRCEDWMQRERRRRYIKSATVCKGVL